MVLLSGHSPIRPLLFIVGFGFGTQLWQVPGARCVCVKSCKLVLLSGHSPIMWPITVYCRVWLQ